MQTLNYAIVNPRSEISLNLYEAELYEPAVVVQSLVGNLVYYSNLGRYEPRLAESWKRVAVDTWSFRLIEGLKTEDGEIIDSISFKASIERTLRYLSRESDFPVLSNLKGYKKFLEGGELEGITASGRDLVFEFDRPVRDGVLQVLSFAPFGYISRKNLKEDGSWKSEGEFVSSGPYSVGEFSKGSRIVLVKQKNWKIPFAGHAPQSVVFSMNRPARIGEGENWIVDGFTSELGDIPLLKRFSLVPEYINSILLSESGFFSDIRNRQLLKDLIVKYRNELPEKWGVHSRSELFYPNPKYRPAKVAPTNVLKLSADKVLLIEGAEPLEGGSSPRHYAWSVLRPALIEAGLRFQFANNETTVGEVSNRKYDIRIRGASSGGAPEPWGLRILFCSDLGPKFSDPLGNVCKLLDQYDANLISDESFSDEFIKTVDEDAAVIPISHYGVQLHLSSQIDQSVLSPALSVLRFDKLSFAE